MAGEKTEKATQKRKQDERKKGNIFMSRDAVTVFSLLITFYAIKLLLPSGFGAMQGTVTTFISRLPTQDTITQADLNRFFLEGCLVFAQTALPLLLVCAAAAIVTTMLQTRMLFSSKSFAFKGERINPLSGLKKMFSLRGAVELLKSIAKISILGYLIYTVGKEELLRLPGLSDLSFVQAMSYTGQLIFSLVLKASIIFAFFAAADYLYQWWEYEKNLRMSKQEIKDEYKQVEGDPQIKGRLRSMQQQRSRRRMMQSVPSADVVIRNPTHFAVAIKYDQKKNRAPVVVAKGADTVALRIVRIAEENNVHVTENKPLARALFDTVALDEEIPEQYFKAVAQVLAFVYALKERNPN